MSFRHTLARFIAPDIFRALAQGFPDFDERPDRVTPERIKKLAQSHMEMMYDTGPSEIDFTDQDGQSRRIVWDSGDWEAGISSGWTIGEDEAWGAFPLNDRGEPMYPVRRQTVSKQEVRKGDNNGTT